MPPRILLLAALLAGCGGAAPRPAPTAAPEPRAECRIGAGLGRGEVGRVFVAAAGPADTALLSPARRRTPIGFDCGGHAVPRGATAWTADSTRRSWTLLVGSAGEVAAAWRRPDAAAALRLAEVLGVVPLDEHRLVVEFQAPQDTVPAVFADPALALPAEAAPRTGYRLLPPSGDLRDAIDTGADIVLTGDPDVLDYGTARGYNSHPLPWSRVYVLLPATGGPPALPTSDTAGFRHDLARDAVRTTARPAGSPLWWEQTGGCPRLRGPAPAPARDGSIGYPVDDRVARAIAERIVALAGAGTIRPLAEPELPPAIGRGAAAAYVLPLPRAPAVPCREVAGWPAGAAPVALIETRLFALLRDGGPPLLVDWDGGLVPAGAP